MATTLPHWLPDIDIENYCQNQCNGFCFVLKSCAASVICKNWIGKLLERTLPAMSWLSSCLFQDGREQWRKSDGGGILEGLPSRWRAVKDVGPECCHVDGPSPRKSDDWVRRRPRTWCTNLRMCTCERGLIRSCIFMYFSAFNPKKLGPTTMIARRLFSIPLQRSSDSDRT